MRTSSHEILVPVAGKKSRPFNPPSQSLGALRTEATLKRTTYGVDGQRTVAPHGLTGPELQRLSDAVHFMRPHRPLKQAALWWATLAKGTARTDVATIWKRITRYQHICRLPAYSVLTFETRGGLHAHIVFIGVPEIARRLRRAVFGSFVEVSRVTDPGCLVRKYLAKERTPQAGYRRNHLLGGRLKGSHRLDGGGDRVRLSRALERDAIEAGAVRPWRHTNAKRAADRKPYRPRRLRFNKAPLLIGQLSLLPEIDRPVSRLKNFGGGFIPPAVALEIEFLSRQCGLSQTQLSTMIGRSQGHLANALRGHDPISSLAVNRLRELIATQIAPRCPRSGTGYLRSALHIVSKLPDANELTEP